MHSRASQTATQAAGAPALKESDMVREAVDSIRRQCQLEVDFGLILGTGLGGLAESMEVEARLGFEEIPHVPHSTVEGHAGEFLLGRLAGRTLVAMNGRLHFYEGYTMKQVAFPVRVMRGLGATTLVVSNAVGGMNPDYVAGDIMVVDDHINLMGANPLIGPNEDCLGPQYPDMCAPYDPELIALVERCAGELGVKLQKGVFVGVSGPNLETRAEYRFLRTIGADVVGMSLIPENLAAVHGGMRCLALSVVTDECIPETLKPANIEEILKIAAEAEPKLTQLVTRTIEAA